MTREEAFRKNFPEYCRGEECLSPYFDLFCAGLEIEESQMYEKTVKPIQEQIEKMKNTRNCLTFNNFKCPLQEQSDNKNKPKSCKGCNKWGLAEN